MHYSIQSNIEKQWRRGMSRNSTASAPGDHIMYFVFGVKWLIIKVFGLNFHNKKLVVFYSQQIL